MAVARRTTPGARTADRVRSRDPREYSAAEADHGVSLLPVLAGRSAQVDDAFVAAFPGLVSRSLSASSGSGYFAGRLAADQASVVLHPEVERVGGA